MRPLVRSAGILAIILTLPGCTAGVVAGTAWVATEALTDRSPLDFTAEFFAKECENLTIYDQPPRCRR